MSVKFQLLALRRILKRIARLDIPLLLEFSADAHLPTCDLSVRLPLRRYHTTVHLSVLGHSFLVSSTRGFYYLLGILYLASCARLPLRLVFPYIRVLFELFNLG